MSYDRPIAPLARRFATPATRPVVQPEKRIVPLTRRFEIMWLDEAGDVQELTKIAPALPAFEEAFSAFTHGTQFATTEGPVAVEDLVPGMRLLTPEGREETLVWTGAITLVPNARSLRENPNRLYRVSADALGLQRPSRDIMLGPDARLLNRDPAVLASVEAQAAFVPLTAYTDGVSVFEIQAVMPVRVYHLRTERHAALMADGLAVESFHPRADLSHSLPEEILQVFLSLFPGKETLSSFGRSAYPRISEEAFQAL